MENDKSNDSDGDIMIESDTITSSNPKMNCSLIAERSSLRGINALKSRKKGTNSVIVGHINMY